MKNKFNKYTLAFGIIISSVSTAHAATAQLIMEPSTKVIANLDQAISAIKAKTKLPVLFPAVIPVPSITQKYYASWNVRADGSYNISIDSSKDCNGAKYCSVGSVMADLGKRPQIYYSSSGDVITEQVNLYKGKKGFYTPAHAEADYWPTMMEWRMGYVLYDFNWKLQNKNEKKIIVNLVDSALKKGQR